jgi:hypothetical protein
MGFPSNKGQRRRFSWLKRQPALIDFPRNQPVNGDIFHGSSGSQPSSVSRGTSRSMATFFMAQMAASLSWVSGRN